MHYGELKRVDIANGPGTRVTLFVSGCRRGCRECFNPETWNFEYGNLYTDETEQMILQALAPRYIHGLTVLGGEPFEPENQPELLHLLRRVKEHYPNKDIWCFTGNTLEAEILPEGSRGHCAATAELLELIDVLVDGPFIAEQKDLMLHFRGSRNQRIIDMNKTRESGHIVLWEE